MSVSRVRGASQHVKVKTIVFFAGVMYPVRNIVGEKA